VTPEQLHAEDHADDGIGAELGGVIVLLGLPMEPEELFRLDRLERTTDLARAASGLHPSAWAAIDAAEEHAFLFGTGA
jgi:hypothetical protein